jgi:SAM-dependent methyltransferase
MKQEVEDFIYKKVIRRLMLMSRLGRQSVLGEASTGYNFDHMYENRSEGAGPIGKLIDRVLLNLPAVQATRSRRISINKILTNEIENHKIENKTTRIVDIACGAGRYLLDISQTFQGESVETLGVDYDLKSIARGQDLAQKYSVPESSLRFFRGNIFRLQLLKRFGKNIEWRPNIIVSSGLTVYIDDQKVLDVLRQVYEGLDRNGLFLVDSQENNPSRKLMEKVCNTKDGAWVLYYRQPAVWREWLHQIGFRDIRVSRDRWHMYNICTARKP